MQRVLPPLHSLPLFDVAATRRLEAQAESAVATHALMQRAGLAVARLALALAPHARNIWVAAGPGNNGGDGFEAALHLHHWGKRVQVSYLADPGSQPADARASMQRAQSAGVPIVSDAQASFTPDFALDALLGIGARRPPDLPIAEQVCRLNDLACPILAIDIPTGLNADTGALLGLQGVIAEHTLSLLTLKPGLFMNQGRGHVGTVWWDTLGVDPAPDGEPSAWLAGGTDLLKFTPGRSHAHHKGSFGDVGIVGGELGMAGAAWLAGRAALAAGAGRVFVDALGGDAPSHDSLRPELMVRPGWARGAVSALQSSLAVCGCGGGDSVREVLPALLSHVPRLVLDADALNAVASDESLRRLLSGRSGRGHSTVLTPHPLEAARLLACTTAQVQAGRLAAAAQLAAACQSVVVLKGSGTVVAAPGQTDSINATGSAALASAGTGDVLAGWLGGLWSQMDGKAGPAAAFNAARLAVFQHGQAADHSGGGPLRASELIEALYRLHARGRAAA